MMITKYFLSSMHNYETVERCIADVEKMRDDYLSAEESKIARIADESIQFIFNNAQVRAIISISIYFKKA